MQIVIALNLLLALGAVSLWTGDSGESSSLLLGFPAMVGQPWPLQVCCLVLALVMALILAHLLTHFPWQQLRPCERSTPRSGHSLSAEAQKASSERSPDRPEQTRMAVWTLFSVAVTFLLQWSQSATLLGRQVPLFTEGLILFPHVVCLLAIWMLGDFAANSTSCPSQGRRRLGWSAWERGSQVIAQQLPRLQMVLLPVLLPIVAVYFMRTVLDWAQLWEAWPTTTRAVVLSFMAMGTLLVVYPFLLSRLWSSQPLVEACPEMGKQLESKAQALRLRIASVQQWNTRLRIANAAVVGWIPGLRKILVTDVLVRILSPAELEAVFLHEAGHVRHSHSLWRLMVVLLPLMAFLVLLNLVPARDWDSGVFLITMTLINFTASAALLAWLSHELELEADRFAWLTMSNSLGNPPVAMHNGNDDLHPLSTALMKTARVTNASIHQNTLLHPSTARRLRQLLELNTQTVDHHLRSRQLNRCKQTLLGGFLLLTGALGWLVLFAS